ncbi:MAG: DUF6268 family outer membrane beta-barrel protein [Verrucomicrobiota bacterium]|nr:DUF6268 family outer membrane beta-barrel protein [Verrucomicrobiota bacterium]
MRTGRHALLFLALLALNGARAGEVPFEYSFDETYVGNADVSLRRQIPLTYDESDTVLDFIFTPRFSIGVLRLGFSYERFAFGYDQSVPLPNRLQTVSAVIGIDTQLSDSILLRFEARPGVYTEDFDNPEWNAPFVVGGTYIYSPELQFVLGVGVDVERKYPVLPGGGVRWRFHPKWVLDAVLPTPRLDFEVSKSLTAYVGGNYKESNFRMNDHFGDDHGLPKLNDAVLTYSEVRVGTGLDWKVTDWLTVNAEAGYQPYRSFDYYRADLRYHEHSGAPYGMISLHGAF